MSQRPATKSPIGSTLLTAISPVFEVPGVSHADKNSTEPYESNSPVLDTMDGSKGDEDCERPTVKHQETTSDAAEPTPRPRLDAQRRRSSRYSQMTTDYFGSIPALYNVLASAFTWILLAGFVVGPSAQQAAQKAGAGAVVTKVPMLVVSLVCSGIGALGMIGLWVRWRSNYLWLVHKVFLPGFLNGLAGTLTVMVNIWAIQGGQFKPNTPAIITISVTGGSTVICFALTIVYQFLIGSVRRQHQREADEEERAITPGLFMNAAGFSPKEVKNSILASLSLYGN